jgi:site-specific recombinase XerD
METTTIPAELNMNVLSMPRPVRERGEHGWYTGGSHSYDWLLKHEVVKDWIDNYTAEQTRKQKMSAFQKVLEVSGFKDPADLLKLNDEEAKRLVKRVAQAYLQQGKHSWARIVVISMRTFYEAHDRELKFKRAERIRSPPRKKISHEHIPTKADAYKMADVAGSLRNRAMILSLLQSGVRVGCLVRWTYGNVASQLYPEIKIPIEIKVTPAMDTKLNSYGLPYYLTFLHEEGAHAVKDYVEDRKRRGWKPQARDLIYVTESSASRDNPMDTTGVWEVVKNSARAAGLDPTMVWTHTLRKSFRKVLNAESSRDLDDDTREALMGHKLPGSRGSYFDYHDENEIREKYLNIDWSRNGNGNGKLKALEEKNTELEQQLERVRGDVGRDLDGIRKDFAILDEIKHNFPHYKDDFKWMHGEFQKMLKLKKEIEEGRRTFHKLTKILAQQADAPSKK